MPSSKMVRRICLAILVISLLAAPILHSQVHAATWSSESQIVATDGADIEPAIIKRSSGTQTLVAFASDQSLTSQYDIYLIKNSGAGWSIPSRIDLGLFGTNPDRTPALVELPGGNLMVVWSQVGPSNVGFDIVYNVLDPSTGRWLGIIDLVSNGYTNLNPTVALTDDATRLCISWHTNQGTSNWDIHFICSTGPNYDFAWDVQETLMPGSSATGDDLSPSAVPRKGGGFWLAWTDQEPRAICGCRGGDIFLSSLTFGSAGERTWSTRVQLTTDTYDDDKGSLVRTKDEGLWLFWQSARDDPSHLADINIFYKRSYDPTNLASWSSDTRLTTDPNGDYEPSGFQVDAGTIGVVWSTNRDGVTMQEDLYYATLKFHNLEALQVQPIPDAVAPGGVIIIQAIVANRGAFPENATATFYANSTVSNQILVGTRLETNIPPGLNSTSLSIQWNTAGLTPARYTVRAEISCSCQQTGSPEETLLDNKIQGGPAVVAVRDIAVVPGSISIPQYIYQGQTINVNVGVANYGQLAEDFSVSLKYNGTTVGTATVSSLPSGATTTVTIAWNTVGVTPGGCTLKAEVTQLTADNNQANNNSTTSYSYASCVRKKGDTDGDRDVDLDDLIADYVHQFTSNRQYDIDGDGDVDIDDLILVFVNQFL